MKIKEAESRRSLEVLSLLMVRTKPRRTRLGQISEGPSAHKQLFSTERKTPTKNENIWEVQKGDALKVRNYYSTFRLKRLEPIYIYVTKLKEVAQRWPYWYLEKNSRQEGEKEERQRRKKRQKAEQSLNTFSLTPFKKTNYSMNWSNFLFQILRIELK